MGDHLFKRSHEHFPMRCPNGEREGYLMNGQSHVPTVNSYRPQRHIVDPFDVDGDYQGSHLDAAASSAMQRASSAVKNSESGGNGSNMHQLVRAASMQSSQACPV